VLWWISPMLSFSIWKTFCYSRLLRLAVLCVLSRRRHCPQSWTDRRTAKRGSRVYPPESVNRCPKHNSTNPNWVRPRKVRWPRSDAVQSRWKDADNKTTGRDTHGHRLADTNSQSPAPTYRLWCCQAPSYPPTLSSLIATVQLSSHQPWIMPYAAVQRWSKFPADHRHCWQLLGIGLG